MSTTDPQPQETLEEIAKWIIREIFVIDARTALSELHPAYSKDYELILEALRNERDRAISIIDAVCEEHHVAHNVRLAIVNALETGK